MTNNSNKSTEKPCLAETGYPPLCVLIVAAHAPLILLAQLRHLLSSICVTVFDIDEAKVGLFSVLTTQKVQGKGPIQIYIFDKDKLFSYLYLMEEIVFLKLCLNIPYVHNAKTDELELDPWLISYLNRKLMGPSVLKKF